MEEKPCFSHYARQAKCERCGVEMACLTATLGRMAERGLLKEEFVPGLGEHIYSLTGKGKEHLASLGLIAPVQVRMGPRRGKDTLSRPTTMDVTIDPQRQEISFVSQNCCLCHTPWTHKLHVNEKGERRLFHVCPKHLAVAQSKESGIKDYIVKIEKKEG